MCNVPQGYTATTIQQYLSQYPVDEDDLVHVEDGGWVNPDGDFGSPQSLNWNWPLIPNNAQVCGWVGVASIEMLLCAWFRQGSLILRRVGP